MAGKFLDKTGLDTLWAKIKFTFAKGSDLTSHTGDTTKHITADERTKWNAMIPATEKGVANGVATLDVNAKIPESQLPSFVDDVIEYESLSSFPKNGESGKIYIAIDTNKTYRWSGTQYTIVSDTLALGETSSTAYRGDRGKTAYDHSQISGATSIHHSHENKTVLDGITSTNVSDWDEANANKHTHLNKAELDKIESGDVEKWNTKQSALTFDSEPTADSTNPVTSGGIKAYVDAETMRAEAVEGTMQSNINNKVDKVSGKGLSTNDFTNALKNKLDGIASNAEVNQNAFANVKVGSVEINAGAKQDTLQVVAGSNVTITPDAGSGKITFSATDTGATSVTTSGSGNAVTSASYDASARKLTLNKGTTFLTSHQTVKQDGVTGATSNHYGLCATAVGTAAKVVNITAGTPALEAGLRVLIKFTNGNTAASPTLAVRKSDGSGTLTTKAIYPTNFICDAGDICEFVYDGANYVCVSQPRITDDEINALS